LGGLFLVLWQVIAVVFFGEKFLYSGVLVSYLGPFLIFSILYGINYGIMAWLGKVKQRVKILAWWLLVNIALNLLLIVWLGWGLVGAVIAIAASWIVLWWFSLYEVNAFQKITFDWGFFIKNFVLTIVLSLVVYIVSSKIFILQDAMIMTNLWYLLAIGLVYCCIIAAFNYKSVKLLMHEVRGMNK
jgi:O-antigen/teichoic acid export membrane protein